MKPQIVPIVRYFFFPAGSLLSLFKLAQNLVHLEKQNISVSCLPSVYCVYPSQSSSLKEWFVYSLISFSLFFVNTSLYPLCSIRYLILALNHFLLISVTYSLLSLSFLTNLLPGLKLPPVVLAAQSYLQHQMFLKVHFGHLFLEDPQASLAHILPPQTWSFSYIP